MIKEATVSDNQAFGYLPQLEVNTAYAKLNPNNCAVIERTADGISVGACTFYLGITGMICPRHGVVATKAASASTAARIHQ